MNRNKIVVIEDEPDIMEIISYNLKREGYSVVGVDRGDEGLQGRRIVLGADELLGKTRPGRVRVQRDQGVQAEARMPLDLRPCRAPVTAGNHAGFVPFLDLGLAMWAAPARGVRLALIPDDRLPIDLRERAAARAGNLEDPRV